MPQLIIAIAGEDGAGKTTLANHLIIRLVEQGHTAEVVAFADAMKTDLDLLGWGVAENSDIVGRPRWWEAWEQRKRKQGVRELLRAYGNGVRAVDPQAWVTRWKQAVAFTTCDVVVADDVRYLNELEACATRPLRSLLLYIGGGHGRAPQEEQAAIKAAADNGGVCTAAMSFEGYPQVGAVLPVALRLLGEPAPARPARAYYESQLGPLARPTPGRDLALGVFE